MKPWIVLGIIVFSLLGAPVSANPIDFSQASEHMLVAEGNAKTLVEGAQTQGIQAIAIEQGAIKANVYNVVYKEGAQFFYAIVGDMQVDTLWISQLVYNKDIMKLGVGIQDADKKLAIMAQSFASRLNQNRSDYQFVVPHRQKDQVYFTPLKQGHFVWNQQKQGYEASVMYSKLNGGVRYTGYMHLFLYKDKYYGPSIRFIMIPEKGVQALWQPLQAYAYPTI